jgi:hypothetical protein
VQSWLVWNEPNNPVFLKPQFKRVSGKWVIQSARDYAKLCNAAVDAIKLVSLGGAKVACGVTGPRGNNNPSESRASVSPLAFLRAMKTARARGFDAYAHHPYYGSPAETPLTPPPPGRRGNAPTAITLGNFPLLVREVTRLYGNNSASRTRSRRSTCGRPTATRAATRASTCSSGSCSATRPGSTAGSPACSPSPAAASRRTRRSRTCARATVSRAGVRGGPQ